MRCPRCGRKADEASWYCAHCGVSLGSVNVADNVDGRALPALLRWALLASLTLLVAVAVVGIGAVVARRAQDRQVASEAAGPGQGGAPALSAGDITATSAAAMTAGAPTARPPRIVTAVVPGTAPPGPPAPPERPDVPIWRIARLDEPPTLDGRLDEWTDQPLDVTSVVFGQNFWRGPEDLSARAYGGWDARALYVAVQVSDDVFSQPSRGEDLYLGDSIELQLDADLPGDWDTSGYNDDDWQIGLSPGDFGTEPPEAFAWRPVLEPLPSVSVAARKLETGYALEAAIPWAVVGFDPSRSGGFGLALNASDNDDPRPAQLTMVSSSPLRSWSDPRSFGTVILLP